VKLLVGGALLLTLGAGLGTYFALRGPAHERPPVGHRNAVLEVALSRGVIPGYQTIPSGYEVTGRDIQFRTSPISWWCGGNASRPDCLYSKRFMFLEYKRPAEEVAQALLRIA
jgi:hypothetical protein